jgi:hypothetical protein
MGRAADLGREQAHLDEAYRALAAMRDRTERVQELVVVHRDGLPTALQR